MMGFKSMNSARAILGAAGVVLLLPMLIVGAPLAFAVRLFLAVTTWRRVDRGGETG